MAKKKSAGEFNMSKAIRDVLTDNPKFSNQEAKDALTSKFPSAKINDNSFSVAFYNARKKLGIGSPRGKKRRAAKKMNRVGQSHLSLSTLRTAARFLSEVGSADAAMEAIKQVQVLQVK